MAAHKPDARIIDLDRARPADPLRVAKRRLGAARRASGLTLAEFAAELDRRTQYRVEGRSVTTWETLAVPPSDLLIAAEQISGAYPAEVEPIRLITDAGDLQSTLAAVVAGARHALAITGSRSRDPGYLAGIERVLTDRPDVVHYRVLYGPPRHGATKNHLLRLFDQGTSASLHVAIARDTMRDQERFLVATESEAVVILPSVHGILNFDTALHCTDPDVAAAWVDHVRQAWLGAELIPDRAAVERLEVV